MATVLVTGGAGFIGSNFVRLWLDTRPRDRVVNLDLLTYAADPDFRRFRHPRHTFVRGDIGDRPLVERLLKKTEAVFHFAAETHVDRSILDSQVFLRTNVLGTHTLLECARRAGVKRFVHVSTDEVYGSIARGSFRETSQIAPNSPYSASKAASDLLARSYWTTYRFPVRITRACNNFGPYQFPEKVIPLFITNLLEDKKVPVYGKGKNVREWIDVRDHCRAIQAVYDRGRDGEIYNVGSGCEIRNIALARKLLALLGRPADSIEFVKDRPGHDLRYSLDSSKLRKLGWKPLKAFEDSLEETVAWYRDNRPWWDRIKDRGSFRDYIARQYEK